jgi:RNA exonuclease 1
VEELLLTPADLAENGYPEAAGGFEQAPLPRAPGGPARLFAVDCEMCYTEEGLELTRLSVVDKFCVPLVRYPT